MTSASEMTPNSSSKQWRRSLVWLFGVDDQNLKLPSNTFLIYQVFNWCVWNVFNPDLFQGSHGRHRCKSGRCCNFRAQPIRRSKAFTPIWRVDHNRLWPQSLRHRWRESNWKIVRRSLRYPIIPPYDTLIGVRQRMKELSPNLSFVMRTWNGTIEPPKDGIVLPKVTESLRLRTRLVDL